MRARLLLPRLPRSLLAPVTAAELPTFDAHVHCSHLTFDLVSGSTTGRVTSTLRIE